jgi:hypothetical protein
MARSAAGNSVSLAFGGFHAYGSPMSKTSIRTLAKTLRPGPRVALYTGYKRAAQLPDDAGRLARQIAAVRAA